MIFGNQRKKLEKVRIKARKRLKKKKLKNYREWYRKALKLYKKELNSYPNGAVRNPILQDVYFMMWPHDEKKLILRFISRMMFRKCGVMSVIFYLKDAGGFNCWLVSEKDVIAQHGTYAAYHEHIKKVLEQHVKKKTKQTPEIVETEAEYNLEVKSI